MPAKKIPAKTGNESVVEEVAVGCFKIEGRCTKARLTQVIVNMSSKSTRGSKLLRGYVETVDAVVTRIASRYGRASTFTIPADVAAKMKLGAAYEIQCTIIEKKGNNEDA